jgi:hypothetical protein
MNTWQCRHHHNCGPRFSTAMGINPAPGTTLTLGKRLAVASIKLKRTADVRRARPGHGAGPPLLFQAGSSVIPTDPAVSAGDDQARRPPVPASANPARHPSPDTPSGATVSATLSLPCSLRHPLTQCEFVCLKRHLHPRQALSNGNLSRDQSAGPIPRRHARFFLNRRFRRLHPVLQIELARDRAASTPSSLLYR